MTLLQEPSTTEKFLNTTSGKTGMASGEEEEEWRRHRSNVHSFFREIERYCLRLLVLNIKGVTSFQNLRRVVKDNIAVQYPTFKVIFFNLVKHVDDTITSIELVRNFETVALNLEFFSFSTNRWSFLTTQLDSSKVVNMYNTYFYGQSWSRWLPYYRYRETPSAS